MRPAPRPLSLLAIVVGTTMSAVACDGDGPDDVVGSNSVAVETVDEAGAIEAAVDVRADGCGPRVGFGTGAVVGERAVVTAAHVVAGADAIEVIAVDGATTTGEVVLFDPDLDLAVIRIAAPVGTPLPLRGHDAERGEQGVVVLPRATADGMSVEVAEVTVLRPANINTTDIYLDREVRRDGFEIEGTIDPGDSGGMVVLPGGGVGIVWARSNVNEQRAWAIDLPPTVVAGGTDELTAAVDVGPCIR